jgi:hypothetical protein
MTLRIASLRIDRVRGPPAHDVVSLEQAHELGERGKALYRAVVDRAPGSAGGGHASSNATTNRGGRAASPPTSSARSAWIAGASTSWKKWKS